MTDTTNSVYDLLPKEDLEALRWMRGQGGLDIVRMHAELFQQLKEERDEYRDLCREYEKRLMPEGMEWPRFEDGEPVRIGGEADFGSACGAVTSVELQDGGYFTVHICDGAEDHYHSQYFPGERVKRPAVIASDGEPLEVGQTVWGTGRFQHKFEVLALNDVNPEIGSRFNVKCFNRNENKKCWCDPNLLTHQRPVLDADGAPIKKGDTVYFTDGREQECNTVVNAKYDYKGEPYVQLGRLNEVGYPTYTNCSCIDPSQLTHTKPDSFERIKDDLDEPACSYFGFSDVPCYGCPAFDIEGHCDDIKNADIVRRLKALFEKDA